MRGNGGGLMPPQVPRLRGRMAAHRAALTLPLEED